MPSGSMEVAEAEERAAGQDTEAGCVQLGLVAAPGLPAEVTEAILSELGSQLDRRFRNTRWRVELLVDPLVEPHADATEIVDAARRTLLEHGWAIALVVTDLPLRLGRRALVEYVSPTHMVALVSLPALGVLQLRRRLRDSLVGLVGVLVAEQSPGERVSPETHDREPGRLPFSLRVLIRNPRLLAGMVHANRPWQLTARLYRALVAATAVSVFGFVSPEMWRIATSVGPLRLGLVAAASIGATVASVIRVHGLWERAPSRRAREQVTLFNLATTLTVLFGIATLYCGLFLVILLGGFALITPQELTQILGRRSHPTAYVELALLVASLATIGGALGGALESDAAVREAAYARRPRSERNENP